jgi:hypothetical protein
MTNMIVSVIGFGSALLAAFFWLWASLVFIPPWPDVGWYLDVFEPFRRALQKVSRLNAIAAAFAGVAAFAGAAEMMLL